MRQRRPFMPAVPVVRDFSGDDQIIPNAEIAKLRLHERYNRLVMDRVDRIVMRIPGFISDADLQAYCDHVSREVQQEIQSGKLKW